MLSVNNRKHEGSDPGRWLRHEAASTHAERSQTAGGILQQTHPAAPGGGAGQGMERESGGADVESALVCLNLFDLI